MPVAQVVASRCQEITEQNGFQINAGLKQRHQQHTESCESSQNGVHRSLFPSLEALTETFRQQGSDHTTDQATDGGVEIESQGQHQPREHRMGHQIGQQDASLSEQQ